MKNNIKRAMVGVVAGASLAVAGAGTANAEYDPMFYLQYLRDEGIFATGGDASLLSVGQWVCSELSNGMTKLEAVDQIYSNTNATFSWDNANSVVAAAVVTLCPVYEGVAASVDPRTAYYAPNNTIV